MPTTNYHNRVAESLFNVENLDNVQMLYVSSETADGSPMLQHAMREVLQDERMRREHGNVARYAAMPEISTWPPCEWMKAGIVVLQGAEAAAMSGDPTLTDFAFRILNWWFLQISTQVAEVAYGCESN